MKFSVSRQSIKLEEEQRQLLEEWVRAHRTPQQVVKRCQIILQSAEGKSDEAIAKELDINRHTCRLWRERFASCGADCLWEVEAGRGRKSQAGLAQRLIEATLHSKPSGQTHWTTRKMAKEQGVHASTVARIWQEHELKPHRQKTTRSAFVRVTRKNPSTARSLNYPGPNPAARMLRTGYAGSVAVAFLFRYGGLLKIQPQRRSWAEWPRPAREILACFSCKGGKPPSG